ncbi:MAG: SDR family oxidoreductase [Solirubrobacteraceae bacterium]|jgi:3-oxoacyl-[acyl-carrier protein] reductase
MTSRGLDGLVAVVTGASRRRAIGAAIARRLAADGASVLVHSWAAADAEQAWGHDRGGAEALVAELRAAGARAEHISADLADPLAPARLVTRAGEAFGGLDILVANHARSSSYPLAELTAAEIDLTYAVNTRATLLLVQALARARPAGPGGRVVLFTSGQYHEAMPGELPYIASKGALHQLTASLAVELMPRGITVNCIDPGPTDTGYADDELRATVSAQSPGGRWGEPDDAARLVAWLAGSEAAWVTGQVIASDGGWSARAHAAGEDAAAGEQA